MKKRQKLIIGGVIVSGFVAAIVFTVVQLSGAVEEIMDATSSKTPDAILASAGIAEGMNVYRLRCEENSRRIKRQT